MRIPKRLTKQEFLELVQSLGESGNKDAQKIAYAALVEGHRLVDIAAEFGVTSPWVMQCRDEYYEKHLRLHHIPPGWVKATVIAPKKRLEEFVREIDKCRAQIQLRDD